MKRKVSYSLVVSDLHFGDIRCSLHSMKTVQAFLAKLQDFAPLERVILLGDILDLQLANWAQAVEGRISDHGQKRTVGFRYFINFLMKETGAREIIYVPGNHDYRIFDYHSVEKNLISPLRQGKKLSGKISFFRTFSDSFLQGILTDFAVRVQVVYPHYSMKVNGRRIILTHGHFFDPTQAFNREVGRIFSGSNTLSKIEINTLRHRYFRRVSMYQNLVSGFSMRKEFRELFSSVYHPFTAIKSRWIHRSRKAFLTRSIRRSIERYVLFCCRPGKVEGVIFGHTHRAGKASFPDGRVPFIWNTGTFLKESNSSPKGSFITIRDDGTTPIDEAVQVHYL